MVLNDVLIKQNVITKILLKEGDKELSKELKVKIMRIRMAYNKIKKNYDDEVKEFTEELIPQEFRELSQKVNKTDEDQLKLGEMEVKINSEYQEFLSQKVNEKVECIDDTFTMDDYSDIIEVNAGNDVVINNNLIKAPDFLEIIYDLFVKE
jgi:hypothetical protein